MAVEVGSVHIGRSGSNSATVRRAQMLNSTRYFSITVLCIAAFASCSLRNHLLAPTPIGRECSHSPPASKRFDRVLIVVFENQDYGDVMANEEFAKLTTRGGLLTHFHGLFHPSYSNYLSMVAGTPIPSCADRQIEVDKRTIGDALSVALLQNPESFPRDALVWKNYAEDYPGYPSPGPRLCCDHTCCCDQVGCPCFTGEQHGNYVRRHVPFLSFVPARTAQCNNVVKAGQFAADLERKTLPVFALYSPNLINDGHNPQCDGILGWVPHAFGLPCARSIALENAAKGLSNLLTLIDAHPEAMRGVLTIVTFDESNDSADNHIYTALLGDMVRPGSADNTEYNAFNVLRTIEDNFGVQPLADGDGCASPIAGVWK